jgi:hypothetical protein
MQNLRENNNKKLSPQRINTSVKKWAHELNREF